jgi:ElaB/YqjD/DUF883 family membrane-anchored ribosome-binding protein
MHATLATAAAGNGIGHATAAGSELEELFDGVDDLIRRVADTENPEIRKLRARVHFAMVAAKGATENGASPVRPQGAQAAKAQVADSTHDRTHGRPNPVPSHPEPAHDHPRPALRVALLVGLGLGLIVSLRR